MDKLLISINDAAEYGHDRLRLPHWANPLDHIKIDIINGAAGPWFHLWAPANVFCGGKDPQDILALEADRTAREWEIYKGPLPDSDAYRAAVEKAKEIAEKISL